MPPSGTVATVPEKLFVMSPPGRERPTSVRVTRGMNWNDQHIEAEPAAASATKSALVPIYVMFVRFTLPGKLRELPVTDLNNVQSI